MVCIGVGATRTTILIAGVNYLADQHGNLVSSEGERIKDFGGTYYLINERGEFVDADGIPIVSYQARVAAEGTLVPQDATTLETPVLVAGGQRRHVGSIQAGGPFRTTSGKQLVNLPERLSGGVLTTTGPTGRISIHGDKDVEIYGMVGFVLAGRFGAPEDDGRHHRGPDHLAVRGASGHGRPGECTEYGDDHRRQRLGDG